MIKNGKRARYVLSLLVALGLVVYWASHALDSQQLKLNSPRKLLSLNEEPEKSPAQGQTISAQDRDPSAGNSSGDRADQLIKRFLEGGEEPLDARLVAAHFSKLVQRLKDGDSAAARLLHESLGSCKNRPSINEGARIRAEAFQRGDLQAIAAVESFSKACDPFTAEQIALDWEIVNAAIELGDNKMRVAFYLANPEVTAWDTRTFDRASDYRRNALRHLIQAAEEGYVDSYWALGDAYASGQIAPQDNMQAFAYQLAWLEGQRATFVPAEWEDFHFLLAHEFAELLTLQEQEQAYILASRILNGDEV